MSLEGTWSPAQTLLTQTAVTLHVFHVYLWALNKSGVLKHEDSLQM